MSRAFERPKTQTIARGSHRRGQAPGRHAVPKEVPQDISPVQGSSQERHRHVSRRRRILVTAAGSAVLGGLTAGLVIPSMAHTEQVGNPPLAAAAAGNLQTAARKVIHTYNETAKKHTGYGYTTDGGKQAIVNVNTTMGPIRVTVTSSRTMPGPGSLPEPNPKYAEAVTASTLLPGGGARATLTPRLAETVLPDGSKELVKQTDNLNGPHPITSTRHEPYASMGQGNTPAADTNQSVTVAEANMDNARNFIGEITGQLDDVVGQPPPTPPTPPTAA